jgi:hypothetical protein
MRRTLGKPLVVRLGPADACPAGMWASMWASSVNGLVLRRSGFFAHDGAPFMDGTSGWRVARMLLDAFLILGHLAA